MKPYCFFAGIGSLLLRISASGVISGGSAIH